MYKVLVVEDEDIIRKGLTFKMDWMSYDCFVVSEASDGEEGLLKIKELNPDIVITDIRMPFKDGLTMIEEGLATNKFETIILTGYSEFEYAQHAISLGVTEYILKPIDFSILAQVLQKLITKQKETSYQPIEKYKNLLDIDLLESGSKYTLQALDYIKNYYPDKVSLADVSEVCGISTVHLNAKLKEDTNYTFNDLLNRYRIMTAIGMIQSDDAMIYEIAELVGFNDYKYFSQVFKKYVGYSPTNFLKE